MWRDYRQGCECDPGSYAVWYFADNEIDANGLVKLVLGGPKRATASALWAHEADATPVPRPGDLAIVTDWVGVAQCVIRTTEVDVVPYCEVTEAFAAAEGEGDRSLNYWKQVHWPYFQREMRRLGREPRVDMPVICHRFEVVYP
jgi:uncharacterized protein YhfF